MELSDLITTAFSTGNATAILAAVIVYYIIYIQRKQTEVTRNSELDNIYKKINHLETNRQLAEKDIADLQRRADSTDEHFNNIEKELKTINETLTELCVLIKMYKKSGDDDN